MTDQPENSAWTERRLIELGSAYWQSSTLHAAVRLGVFGSLAKRRLTAKQLAEELGCERRALGMLLRALAALGLLELSGDGYCCTEFARQRLDPGSPAYLGDILQHHHHLVPGWFRLDRAVQRGEPEGRSEIFSETEWREAFLRGMFNLANLAADHIAPKVPLAGRKRLLDVGGGPGTYALRFCQQFPGLSAEVFDLPTSRPYFEETLQRFGLAGRVGFVAGDFLVDALPGGYDVAWLSHVLHGESPARCKELVAKAAGVLEPGGVMLIHEFILDDERPGPLFPALFALNMLLHTPDGQSYSEGELREMMQQSGITQVSRLELTGGPSGVLLGVRQ